MDSHTSLNTLKCQSSQQTIISVTDTEPHLNSKSLPPMLDISFSSYVKHKESLNLPPKIDDSEINVFDAHKYFNEPNETNIDEPISLANPRQNNVDSRDLSTVPCSRLSTVSSADGCERNYKTSSFRLTPAASSEASWNSRTGLLSYPPGPMKNPQTNKHHKKKISTSRWLFCRKCPCSGKKSVKVEEPSTENRTPEAKIKNSSPKTKHSEITPEKRPIIPQNTLISNMPLERQQRIVSNTITISAERFQAPKNPQQQCVSVMKRSFGDGPTSFSFPVLTPSFPSKPAQKIPIAPSEEPGRFSLDVFQPKTEPTNKKSMEIQTQTDDDIESDASSDLFEIESFSTGHRRDSLDDASRFISRKCPTSKLDSPLDEISECYAPSEVSVDWSVTTAEGFDRRSVGNYSMSVSEICQLSRLRNHEDENEFSKKKGMGLLSCRHENSVSVGQRKIKCVPEGHCYL
ncbi:hypothetical protein LIER_11314 [Lithospermum erythrorhizon]|uniref:Uncharacterized protein n=1 Tax=Lithospermum erythrorhizon TaxID=34254 RepID=A0AAV3PMH7_LITER